MADDNIFFTFFEAFHDRSQLYLIHLVFENSEFLSEVLFLQVQYVLDVVSYVL